MKYRDEKKRFKKLTHFNPDLIPKGPCCYEYTEDFEEEIINGNIENIPKTRTCPYYVCINAVEGHCLITNYSLKDQEKLCKYNWEDDEIFEKWFENNFSLYINFIYL
jgi:hypothetical protein